MDTRKSLIGAGGLLLIVALATPGCATKNFARQQAGGVEQRVEQKVVELEQRQTEAISSLDEKMQQNVSRVEERAMTAENRAKEAAQAAEQAHSQANQATELARNATQAAEQNQHQIGELRNTVQGIDQYRLVASEDIPFRFDQAQLTPEANQKLENVIQTIQGMDRYVIEVQGFTDRSGPRDYNLALSRRRADAVVRHLVQNEVPLRRIHMIGLGPVQPTAADAQVQPTGMRTDDPAERETRLTPRQMRRVVVNIWAPETTMAADATVSGQQLNGNRQQRLEEQQGENGQQEAEQQPVSPARP